MREFYRMRSVLTLGLVVAICSATACGPTRGKGNNGNGNDAGVDGQPQPHTLVGLSVTPTNPLVELDLNAGASFSFTANGNYLDGVPEDLSTQVNWAVSDPVVGSMNGSTLLIPGFATSGVHVARVTAKLGSMTGTAQITVVAYRKSGTQQDFFFVLPYQDPAGQAMRPLDFATKIPALDVFFSMDTTGSMFDSITNLQSALTSIVVPGVRNSVQDSQFGVGALEDFPVDGYGTIGSNCTGGLNVPDQPFQLLQPITSDITSVADGVSRLRTATGPIGCGADWPEAGMEALYQASTGEGLSSPAPTSVAANHSGVGGVGFRTGTMPVIMQISDAMTHGPGEPGTCFSQVANYANGVGAVAHNRPQTRAALNNICARVVGVAAIQDSLPEQCSAQEYLEDFATSTGSRVPPQAWDVGARPAGCGAGQCCTDFNGTGRAPDGEGLCPLVFRANTDGSGLGSNIVTGVQMLTRFATFDVNSERNGVATDVDGVPLTGGHTTVDFLKMITPASFVKPPPPPALPDPTFDSVSFHKVTPSTKVSFNVSAFNDFVPQTANAQVFRATIRVLAGGCTALDQRDVVILVPANPIVVN
jgi:hypothetical protein